MATDATIDAGLLGNLKVKTTSSSNEDRHETVVFSDSRGKVVKKLHFERGGPGHIELYVHQSSTPPTPIIFVISSWLRADGVELETIPLMPSDGRLQELFSSPVDADLQDGICISKSGSTITVLHQDNEADYCVLCWPKYFMAETFIWNGKSFHSQGQSKTSKLHQNAVSAANELSLDCSTSLFNKVFDD